jgi:hypothetical protein
LKPGSAGRAVGAAPDETTSDCSPCPRGCAGKIGNPPRALKRRNQRKIMTYRVTYPGLMQDLVRYFDSEAEAKAFANERRNAELHMFRHVKVEALPASKKLQSE